VPKKTRPRLEPPTTEQLRRWVAQGAFKRPAGLRLESVSEDGESLVVSFRVPAVDWSSLLTRTETEIAHEVLAGLSNAEIAKKRGTAVRTIANQVASIYRKLQVRSRLELSLYALAGRHTFDSKDGE
jgi:DNA-binding NarL/FixJ family response regulator